MTEQTEEELAEQRHKKFGQLPPRVRPEDRIESEETEPAHEDANEPMVRREWG